MAVEGAAGEGVPRVSGEGVLRVSGEEPLTMLAVEEEELYNQRAIQVVYAWKHMRDMHAHTHTTRYSPCPSIPPVVGGGGGGLAAVSGYDVGGGGATDDPAHVYSNIIYTTIVYLYMREKP